MEEGRSAEVHSADMDFFLDKDQRLERAVAMRDTRREDSRRRFGNANDRRKLD